MKKITVPNNITLKVFNQETQKEEEVELSFVQFLIGNPLSDVSFGASYDLLESSDNLIRFLQSEKAPQPGEALEIGEHLWAPIDNIVNYPKKAYDPRVARQLLPFMRAIRNAEDVP